STLNYLSLVTADKPRGAALRGHFLLLAIWILSPRVTPSLFQSAGLCESGPRSDCVATPPRTFARHRWACRSVSAWFRTRERHRRDTHKSEPAVLLSVISHASDVGMMNVCSRARFAQKTRARPGILRHPAVDDLESDL